jgi:hypothetical protein
MNGMKRVVADWPSLGLVWSERSISFESEGAPSFAAPAAPSSRRDTVASASPTALGPPSTSTTSAPECHPAAAMLNTNLRLLCDGKKSPTGSRSFERQVSSSPRPNRIRVGSSVWIDSRTDQVAMSSPRPSCPAAFSPQE